MAVRVFAGYHEVVRDARTVCASLTPLACHYLHHSRYARIAVRVLAGYRKSGFITSVLEVQHDGEPPREIRHYWFDSWPGECRLPGRGSFSRLSLSRFGCC